MLKGVRLLPRINKRGSSTIQQQQQSRNDVRKVLEGLPRNNVDRITDRPDMTSAVYGGRKASTQNPSIFCWSPNTMYRFNR